ncbi:GGDEF domain-containing protein [Acinetobacter seifertii]|uniref:GGDEF domain-containing protein n=1 Tax=Acinetobacter seifertii TaxID=1530123 RepID=UPI000A86E208|nr:GGDEF domain-containing protein [Acinetobacter seifertii]
MQYFILIVPSCLFLIGLAFTFCRLIFKADLFLLWIGLAYVIPSIALFAQCLMDNAQLTLAAPFTAILYLLGSWFGAYAISLKLNVSFRHKLALAISLCTIAILTYFSYIQPQIWVRLIILNISLGLVGFITIPYVLKKLPSSKSFDKWILIFYLISVSYSFFRAGINFIFLEPIDQSQFTLTSSVWWLLCMSANILLNILFALVISGCAVKDVIHHLNNERFQDPLTHLLNRRGFFEKNKVIDFGNSFYFLIYFDLDHFKTINDTWGHYTGDLILKGVSEIILNNKKANDLVARFGGEEFICLISAKNERDALHQTQRLKALIEQTVFTNNKIRITASYGLTSINNLQDIEQALHRADHLLYRAKANGRNQISSDFVI